MSNYDKQRTNPAIWVMASIFGVVLSLAIGLAGCPIYNVWQKELAGKASLKKAAWSRQIKIKEAEAAQESAKFLAVAHLTRAEGAAKAEVARAVGVAKANKIIGQSLKGNEVYLRYLWIKGLQDGSSEVIYVPTEANLPILEATRKLQK